MVTLWTGLFLGEHGLRFDPSVGLDGRRFLAMLRINEVARCLGLPSLFAHLCKQGIERGEHRLVIESDGALPGGRFGVEFALGVGTGIAGGRHPAGYHLDRRAPYVTAATAIIPDGHHADARLPTDG